MSDDEVELGGKAAGEDYEVVPVGPLRKLERRVDELQNQHEKGGSGIGADDDLVRDVLDIMKSNQKIVNDMTESTHELKNSVEDLTHKMDEVVDNMNTFMDLLTEASEMDMEGELVGDMEGRIAEAIGTKMDEVAEDMRKSNQEVVDHLNNINQSLRRTYAAQGSNQGSGGRKGGSQKPMVQRGSKQKQQSNQKGGKPSQHQTQSQNNQTQSNQDQGQQQRQRSRNTSRSMRGKNSGNDSNLELGSDNDERLEKLRERFNKNEAS